MRVALALFLVACGPVQVSDPFATPAPVRPLQMTARVKNEYAESLFTMSVIVTGADGGVSTTPIFSDRRVPGFSSAEGPFEAFPGDQVQFDFSALSLGQRQNFSRTTLKTGADASKKTLEVLYDFDLATADFTIRYSWR